MDTIDKKIISILKEDGRIPYKEIANKVYLSQPAVKERIMKLIEKGYITKFTIETKTLLERGKAFVFIKTTRCRELEEHLRNSTSVIELYRMAGVYNYCIKIYAKDTNELILFQKSLRDYGPSQLHIITEEVI